MPAFRPRHVVACTRAKFCQTFLLLAIFGVAGSAVQAQKPVFWSYYPTPRPASATAPSPQGPVAAPIPCDAVAPAAEAVAAAVSSVDIRHWKLSHEKKDEMQGNVDSMHQDLAETLPALIQVAKATPTALAPEWAVMQNVDALYDVMVRVTTAASLAAPKSEAAQLIDAQNQLALTRKSLTDQLVAAAGNQDRAVMQLQTQLASLSNSGRDSGRIVVDNTDHPHKTREKKPEHKARKKVKKEAAPTPASSPNSTSRGTPAGAGSVPLAPSH